MPDLKSISVVSPITQDDFIRYYKFRWQQLRQPLNLAMGSERDGYESISFHCMAIDLDEQIIGVGRISPEANKQMRIRYMAVLDKHRTRGVGSMILKSLLKHAKYQNATRCWLNARSHVVPFYEKNGFKVVKPAETDLEIPHMLMEIYLKP